MTQSTIFNLIIDTEQYAGNFEREMCAFITGQLGECAVGQGIEHFYKKDIVHLDWWKKHIVQKIDSKNICHRPVSIYTTPGWFNNGYGLSYKDTPKNEAIAQEKAVKIFIKDQSPLIKKIEKALETNDFSKSPFGYTKNECHEYLEDYNKKLEKMTSSLTKYPAYNSVAIFTDEKPPKEVWEEFQKRAKEFCLNAEALVQIEHSYQKIKSLTVTNFRIECEQTTTRTIAI